MNPLITPESRVELAFMSVVGDGDEYVVGNPRTRTFVTMPEIGVQVLRELGSGSSVAQTSMAISMASGSQVDVPDFITMMAEHGLITSIDGIPLRERANTPAARSGKAVEARALGILFSRPAWIVYALGLLWSMAVLVTQPGFRPAFEDTMFYPDPAVSFAGVAAVFILLGFVHELAHWLAAYAAGVPASITLGVRWFIPVLETDLTGLWSVERRKRYGPFLAGMALDSCLLAASLGLRLKARDLPPVVDRALAVVILTRIVSLLFQCLVFLRTDLTLVLTTALGTRDIHRTARLFFKARLFWLSANERAVLESAHERDRRVAPLFGVLYIVGLGVMLYVFVNFWIPGTALVAGWIGLSLGMLSPLDWHFWEATLLVLLMSMPVLAAAAIQVRRVVSFRQEH